MNELRRFPFACFCLTLISIAGFCFVFGRIELLAIAGLLALISWYVTEGPRGRTIPRWVSNVLVVVFLVNMFFDARSNVGDLPQVLGRFTVWLLLVKLYERRTARDHGQLLGLSLLLMLIGCAEMPPPLGFGILLLVYAGVGTYCLLLFQLYAAHERVHDVRQQRGIVGVVATRPTIGRRVGPHLRRLAVGVGLGTVAVSVLIFILFPRDLGRGAFVGRGFGGEESHLRGFGREVTLGDSTRISDSPRILFRARVLSSDRGLGGPGTTFLLRASALEVYEDRKWKVVRSGTVPLELPRGQEVPLTQSFDGAPPPPNPPLTRLRFSFNRATDTILHLGAPWSVKLDGVTGSRRIRIRNATREVRLAGGGETSGYEISSVVNPDARAIAAVAGTSVELFPIGGEFRNRNRPIASAIRREAQNILLRRGIPVRPEGTEWARQVANAFQEHLTGGQFTYTLDRTDQRLPSSGAASDPIVHFLTDSRAGHCEYFASAHAALCQSIGVHARMVLGFAASEFDPANDQYIVRANHAHAWTEVGMPGDTWVTYDPTPASVTAPTLAGDQNGFANRANAIFAQVEGTWSDRFVGYDPNLQQDIYSALESASTATLGRWWARVRQWASDVNRAFYFGPAGYVWLGIVGLAGVIAVLAAARWIRRRRRIRRGLNRGRGDGAPTERAIRGLAFYFDMLDVLQRAGLDKPDWQPPLEFSRRVAERRPELARPVRELAERYYRGRFGGDLPDDAEIRELRQRVGTLAADLGVRA
ncbi:MAG: DUF3488 and DUF4129 domain-containing transglutaminase family protein [Phycisphaerales bacterium]